MINFTEATSTYRDLEKMSTLELLSIINQEDQTVPLAVAKELPRIEALVNVIAQKMADGGRLFYLGAGTSGRLGIVDASECPPTFGVPHDWVIGLIAGGDYAIRHAVEHAEDDTIMGWYDLQKYYVNSQDVVVGIAASGVTPYVVNCLKECQLHGIATACITCNADSPAARFSDYPVEVLVGPEVITGSTRMKAGTAQKLVLTMISTGVMVRLGRVEDNKMVDMQLTNAKLIERGTRILTNALLIDEAKARQLLLRYGSVRKALHVHIRDNG